MAWFFILVFILGIWIIAVASTKRKPSLQNQRTQNPHRLIEWKDVETPTSQYETRGESQIYSWIDLSVEPPELDDDFLDPGVPDDLDNLLRDVIGTKDFCSQETFIAGEYIYFCRLHKMAYHEDSWDEVDRRCPVCGNDAHTGRYRLPG